MSSKAGESDLSDIFAHMREEPYEGKDPNTTDDWYCKACFKHEGEEGAHLRTCSKCNSVRYCSTECQREDLQREHRTECREIHATTAKMNKQAEPLRNFRGWSGQEDPHNLFETDAGHFWGILDTRDYCRSRYELQSELRYMAHMYEVGPLLEKVLDHQLELLRLMASDNLGMRDVVPFTLLSLNRDDDAYAFIKYWIPILEEGSDETDRHLNTSRGQWIYPRGQDKREDVLEVLNCCEDYFSLAFLAALCIIKLRMIAAHQDKVKRSERGVKALSETKMGQNLDDSIDHIEQACASGEEEARVIREQERHVERYFGIIQKNNPTLLPSIVNPGPLKSQPQPAYIQGGTPSEAWEVLNNCSRHFARIPGVLDRIEGIVGKNPSYNFSVHGE